MFCAFQNVAPLFTTHLCFNRFIDQFKNPVTSARAEDTHSWKAVGSDSWISGREEMMMSRKKVYYLHLDDWDISASVLLICLFRFISLNMKKKKK